ncbi:MAG: S41 family peptidase [Spirochaetes bacterium]|nr:S41 family peptidase [Spirochaetota bacterium]
MSDNDSQPDRGFGYKKTSFSWVWIAATAALCVVFFLALVPVAAQGASSPGAPGSALAQNAQARRYTALIQNVFEFIQRNYIREVDPNVLFEGAMRGMFESLEDPYSAFMPRSEMQALRHTTQGSFGGVGLYITPGRGSYVEVAAPIEGTPGWRAGINPGDLIIGIDGESTGTLSMDQVLARLRGEVGQDVELLIRRDTIDFYVTLTRAVIEVPTTRHAMIGETGYLRLISFTPMTAARTREAIAYFQENNFTSMILDLRNNSGGLLTSAVEISSLFLDGGLVVRTRSRIPFENRDFNATHQMIVPADIPLVVLINRGSASASEIVAGALKDRGRAFLVGEQTFGKGSVQQVYPLDGAGFRITTARYYTPSDASIDQIGIPPDREVRPPQYSDTEVANLGELMRAARIPDFVRENPQAGNAALEAFSNALSQEFDLPVSLIRRLVRNEQNRTVIAPVFDIEYDVQLIEALDILRSGIWPSLMPTRSLRALQDEREQMEQEFALAS